MVPHPDDDWLVGSVEENEGAEAYKCSSGKILVLYMKGLFSALLSIICDNARVMRQILAV